MCVCMHVYGLFVCFFLGGEGGYGVHALCEQVRVNVGVWELMHVQTCVEGGLAL